ncbi:hypothetical protein ACJIZ3_001361 [Penstemon smallii]|uniref:AB hydrolase-1 domain-containing protein n=1 Tax=Penstemon smallii TaxID=265156 RepID=A0ABD3U634_9LAMI
MAIITEQQNESKPQLRKSKPKSNSTSPPPQPPSKSDTSTAANPFHFWFYFTIVVSLISLSFTLFSSLSPQDPKTWFLNLPPILRHHYSNGRTIKVQTTPNHPQVGVFSIQQGPTNSDSNVLIVPGIGCSSFSFHNIVKYLGNKYVHVVSIDLPGSGFSDKSITVVEDKVGGNNLWDVYEEIKEKGLFWGFDQLVEQGYVNNEELISKKEIVKSIELGSEEMGRVLSQVVDSMGLTPVDLVLHDSAFGLSANWISENRGLIRSVVILDSLPAKPALPVWVLEVPLVREIVLGSRFAFERVLAMCCVKSIGAVEAEAHRILLKGRNGRRAVVGMGKKLNFSFDLAEWSGLDGIRGLPIRLIWSSGWSEEWFAEGRRVSEALPQAMFVTHSGGRWTQEHNAEEVGESIYEFVTSLPKPTKQVVEEPIPEAKIGDPNHHQDVHGSHDHHNGHGHAHAGYMDAHGLDHGWAM